MLGRRRSSTRFFSRSSSLRPRTCSICRTMCSCKGRGMHPSAAHVIWQGELMRGHGAANGARTWSIAQGFLRSSPGGFLLI